MLHSTNAEYHFTLKNNRKNSVFNCLRLMGYFRAMDAIEFSLTEIFVITVKGFEPATSCIIDQNATVAPARHMSEMGSLN